MVTATGSLALVAVTTPAIAEVIIGTGVSETIRGTPEADVIFGRAGTDRIYGRGGTDLLVGGHGYDSLVGADGSDTLRGGDQADWLYPQDGTDCVYGGPDGDEIRIGKVDGDVDYIFCGRGADAVYYRHGIPRDPLDVLRKCEAVWVRGSFIDR
jgi:Ca2+-binding RTX toxin-like protein